MGMDGYRKSCKELETGKYEVGCLCVIPEFQGRGIGTTAMGFARSFYSDWKSFTLVTPVDKSQNVKFYKKNADLISSLKKWMEMLKSSDSYWKESKAENRKMDEALERYKRGEQ